MNSDRISTNRTKILKKIKAEEYNNHKIKETRRNQHQIRRRTATNQESGRKGLAYKLHSKRK